MFNSNNVIDPYNCITLDFVNKVHSGKYIQHVQVAKLHIMVLCVPSVRDINHNGKLKLGVANF